MLLNFLTLFPMGDNRLSDLGCRVQRVVSEHCCYRRNQGGRGSSHSGTSYQLTDWSGRWDTETAQMNSPYSRNLGKVVYFILSLFSSLFFTNVSALVFVFLITWWTGVTSGLSRWGLKSARATDGGLSTTLWAFVARQTLTSCDTVR